jgi:hypothetical protein
MTLVSIYEALEGGTERRVHLTQFLPAPSGQSDLPFLASLSAAVFSMGWSVAAAGSHGECLDLPPRPPRPEPRQ